MNRKKALENSKQAALFTDILQLHAILDNSYMKQFSRSLPLADELLDRWERASKLGFGEGSSIYDSSFVFGNVVVGQNTWIGPFTIIDGSGGLSIANNCTISAGVHIYTHENVAQTLTGGKADIIRESVEIGECCYIGPNAVISKGVKIGPYSIIGVGSFVNRDIPPNSFAAGLPARILGKTIISGDKITIEYQ